MSGIISGETIVAAEKLLRVVVGDGMNVQGQFEHYKVDRQGYENFHQEMMSLFISRVQSMGIQMPRTLVPVINTIMVHHFLVGVVCGRMTAEEKERAEQ